MNDSMSLVEHVKRTESGHTRMQIRISISMRAVMVALSRRLGVSQLAIVRSALAAYLLANEPTWQGTTLPAPAPEPVAEVPPAEPVAEVPPAEVERVIATEADVIMGEATEAQPEVQTPAPPPQAATEANAARAARHRSKLLSRKPTETRKPRTKQANS